MVARFSFPEAPTEHDDGTLILFREPGKTSEVPRVLDAIEADRGVATLLTGVGEEYSLEVARKRLQIVAEVSEAISDTLDEQPLLTLIMKKLFQVFPQAERGFIMLTEEGQDDLQAKVALTRSGEPAEFAVSRTLVRDAIDNRRGILSADATGDERYAKTKTVLQLKLRSVICVPMIARGDVFGIIHLDGAEKNFVKDDIAILIGIARQAAVSLSNARTHARLLKQRLTNEDLSLARKIQSHFLPHQLPQAPGYAFCDFYRSALDIGGDYYDFLSLPESHMGIAVGDVSGKGVSAALCMAKLSSEGPPSVGGENRTGGDFKGVERLAFSGSHRGHVRDARVLLSRRSQSPAALSQCRASASPSPPRRRTYRANGNETERAPREIVTKRGVVGFLGSASDQMGRHGDSLEPEDISQENSDGENSFLRVAADDEERSFRRSRRVDRVFESAREGFPGDDIRSGRNHRSTARKLRERLDEVRPAAALLFLQQHDLDRRPT